MRARDNPFATVHIHRIRYQFDGLTWTEFLDRLERMRCRGAIVGPEGAGKSTLLGDLRPKLRERGLQPVPLRLTQESPRFSTPVLRELSATMTSQHVVLLDGAEQMSRWAWWRFRRRIRRAHGLVITAHRSGLLPTVLNCETTPELLENLVRRLVPDEELSREDLQSLFHQHHGNIRDAFRALYDDFGSRLPRTLCGKATG
jgi:hypothetical protein